MHVISYLYILYYFSRSMMSAQKTHHILAFDHVFGSFHLVKSAFIVVYLILDFL